MTFICNSAYHQAVAISLKRDINQTSKARTQDFITKCFIRKYLTQKIQNKQMEQVSRDVEGDVVDLQMSSVCP